MTPPGTPAPGGSTAPGAGVYDASMASCNVSYDGVIWYAVPAGGFSPIDVVKTTCGSGTLSSQGSPAIPKWAIPHGPTQTRFIATSLQQNYSLAGMQSIEAVAAPNNTPMSWLIGTPDWLRLAGSWYQKYHDQNGDDVEGTSYPPLIHGLQRTFSWYVPMVSAEGAGQERNIAGLMALGERAFWGIAWNSHGVDHTYDYGAPWGSYCADPSSYKRPQPGGGCTLLAFEWTARDLTRAYLSGHEEYFSTDPDDLQQRAGFSTSGAQTYIRQLADAYAAAGETQPIVMMSQQESDGNNTYAGDSQILDALYSQARHDGMKVEEFADGTPDARTFSAAPRAVAFPYIPGGTAVASSILNGGTLYPATIDYHDDQTGMTFLAGHTLPTRLFRYADDPKSYYNVPLVSLPASAFPKLDKAVVSNHVLALQFEAPVSLHFGIALWSNPSVLRITKTGAIPAGRAGEVVVFDLHQGTNQIVIPCLGCAGGALHYST